MKILGIETSCDETSAAVVEDGHKLLSNVVATSIDLTKKYGGVVPEIAARSHIEYITPVIEEAMSQAGCSWNQINGIAVTYGAGLSGCLLVGVLYAKSLAIVKKLPLWGINHIEGHVYSNFLTDTKLDNYRVVAAQPKFPMLALIVSGGHSQLVLFENHFKYRLLGQTQDDAIGEAFDKVAKILGLSYPGGPSIALAAEQGDPKKYRLPKAQLKNRYDFSFSGLKTAVLRLAQAEVGRDFTLPSFELPGLLNEAQKADIAASFQNIAIQTLVDKTIAAEQEFKPASVVIAGGVAANSELRRQLAARLPRSIDYADPKLCTDNGAMIATLGCFKAALSQPANDPYKLTINPSLVM